MDDIHPEKLARLFFKLEPRPALTERYIELTGERHRVYRTERQHMVHWFESQDGLGSGAYSRRKPNKSSKRAYNRLQTAPGLFWIAEVLRVDAGLIQAAMDLCLAEPSKRKRYKIIRDNIPWELVALGIPEVRKEFYG